jgi:hypothetical protein
MQAMMAALQRRLDQNLSHRERQFFSHSLESLSITSGIVAELDRWTITAFEVEFGRKIGSGGLCVMSFCTMSLLTQNSGEVFEGTWNMTPIALKVLKTEQGIIPGTPVRDSLPSSHLFVTKPNVKTMRQEIEVSGNPVKLKPTSNLSNIDMVQTFTS